MNFNKNLKKFDFVNQIRYIILKYKYMAENVMFSMEAQSN